VALTRAIFGAPLEFMGKETNIQYPTRNIQLMKERLNTKDNHLAFDLQDRFINIDSAFNQAFAACFKKPAS